MDVTKKFIESHRYDDPATLALKAASMTESGVDVRFAIRQIAGRQAVEHKIPSWYRLDDIIYPMHLSLEQCSSELTARYKASLLNGDTFTDLTGGFGVDCAFIAEKYHSVFYVERQTELCEIARYNFKALDLLHVHIIQGDALDYLSGMASVDCIYIDPARRSDAGKKTVAITDCEPDLGQIKDLLLGKASVVLAKLSPMLDISLAMKTLPETKEIHVISVDNECKELLFLIEKDFSGEPVIKAVNLLRNGQAILFSFVKTEEQDTVPEYTVDVLDFLYEPNASILKSGAYKSIARKFNLKKLHPDSHLYTSDQAIENFPGRSFRTDAVFSLSKKDLKEHLNGLKQANISIRNFPLSVNELRKKTGIKDGGDIYLFATTLNDGKKVLVKTHKYLNTPLIWN